MRHMSIERSAWPRSEVVAAALGMLVGSTLVVLSLPQRDVGWQTSALGIAAGGVAGALALLAFDVLADGVAGLRQHAPVAVLVVAASSAAVCAYALVLALTRSADERWALAFAVPALALSVLLATVSGVVVRVRPRRRWYAAAVATSFALSLLSVGLLAGVFVPILGALAWGVTKGRGTRLRA